MIMLHYIVRYDREFATSLVDLTSVPVVEWEQLPAARFQNFVECLLTLLEAVIAADECTWFWNVMFNYHIWVCAHTPLGCPCMLHLVVRRDILIMFFGPNPVLNPCHRCSVCMVVRITIHRRVSNVN